MSQISMHDYESFISKLSKKLFGSEIQGIEYEQLEGILEKIDQILEENYNLNIAIDYSVDNIHLADAEGKVLRVSDSFVKTIGLTRGDIENRNVEDLERQGVYTPSVALLALKERRKLTMIQSRGDERVITTSTPVFNESGELIRVVSNARYFKELQLLNEYLQKNESDIKGAGMKSQSLIFVSEEMKSIISQLEQIAKFDSGVLLTGESGTGKSILAKYVHQKSNRAKNNFISINCAAIPENLVESELFGYESGAFTGARKGGKPGLIELADKGTLFLDEIGDMPLSLQSKLLQVIQDRKITRLGGETPYDVDIRIISATNKSLSEMVRKGLFRYDLYYRLNVIPIHIPPLRERKDDIRALIEHFVNVFNQKYNINEVISNDVVNRLVDYDWAGNVRELENCIERLIVTDRKGLVTIENLNSNHMPEAKNNADAIVINQLMPLKDAFEQVEKQLVLQAYKKSKNSYKVADFLGISQSGAHRKIQKYIK